jgi:uncharacterized SAM-binding protein YcdF (DUF218 family)
MKKSLEKKTVKPRISYFLIISGTLFIIYFLCITLYIGYFNAFNTLWLFAGFSAITLEIFKSYISNIVKKMAKWVKIPLIISISLGCLGFTIIEIQILYAMRYLPKQDADYLIILGARVNGNIPSLAMVRRTNAALSYLRINKNTEVIVSGGQGGGETISEADAMAHMLQINGISGKNIIIENKSTSTFENLTHCMSLINSPDSRIVFVTSEFHIYRLKIIAKRIGYRNYTVLSSKTPLILLPNYMIREFLAIIKDILITRTFSQS